MNLRKLLQVILVAEAAFFIAVSPVLAQWQVPNHTIPLGRGAGTGFNNAPACTNNQALMGNTAADPACRALLAADLPIVPLTKGGLGADQSAATINQIPVYPGAGGSASPTSASAWFDGAYCSTIGYVIVRLTGAWTCSNTQPVNARWLGATGNNSTDDTTALNLCISTAIGIHGSCYIPAGQYKTTASLTAGSHINIYGDGPQSSGQQCYTSAGCSNLNAAAMANTTTILPNSTTTAFNIASDDAVQIHDLQVGYTTQPTALSGISCFIIGPTISTHNVSQTSIWNTMCSGADRGLYSLNCIHCSFHNNHFYNEVSFSIIIDGTPANTNGNVGDWEIASNIFVSGSSTVFSHISINAGGGGRIVNNKLDAAGGATAANISHGILISPQATNASIEPMVIVGNTIEGCDLCIHFTNPGTGVTATQGLITGNQIWASNNAAAATKGIGIKIDSGSQWVSGLTISGNFINVDGTAGSVGLVIGNSAASNVNVTGNTFGAAAAGGVAWTLGTGLLNVKVDGETNLTSSTNVGMADTTVRRTYALGLYSVTAFTTIATLIPSTTATFAAGIVRCDLGGNTATTGSGHRTSVWTFDIPNAATTAAVLGADVTAGAAPPGFRLNISGNNIQVQVQSSDGTHALSIGYMACSYELPNGTNPLTWLVSN